VVTTVVLAVSCSSSKPPKIAECAYNSDCEKKYPSQLLVCAQGVCRPQCVEQGSVDCPSGQECITFTDPVAMTKNFACQAPEKKSCAQNHDCSPLICAQDLQCRSECMTDDDCPRGIDGTRMKCALNPMTATLVCVDPVADPMSYDPVNKVIIQAPTGGGGATGTGGMGGKAAGGGGKGGSGSGGKPSSGCTNPQTAFGNTAFGDPNPSFTSGVAARVAGRLLLFSAYVGPSVALGAGGGSGDAGGAGGATTGNYVFVQPFDPVSGVALGSSTPLFKAADGSNFGLWGATAVSSAGEVVLLTGTGPNGANNTSLVASFISTAGGSAQFEKSVVLESAEYGNVTAFWSEANSEFVIAWKNSTNGWLIRTKKFQPGGTPAGGDTSSVNLGAGIDDASWTFGVGASGHLFGVSARAAANLPTLALLDSDGNAVGAPFAVGPDVPGQWINVGGTTKGLVVSWQRGNTAYFTFIPKLADDSGVVPQSAGGAGGGGGAGGAAGWTSFNVGSTATGPNVTFTSSDELGAGGVGTVYRETNGASFIYVSADGAKHYAVGTVLSSTTGSTVSITNYGGSFSVSLFETKNHSTEAVASGCNP